MKRAAPVYTIGYHGRALPSFVHLLQEHGVKKVLDVRELPLSRQKGFSKGTLSEALSAGGIEYVHLREAGNPFRKLATSAEECLGMYRSHLKGKPKVLDLLEGELNGEPTAILCLEAEPSHCHRSVITDLLRKRWPKLVVTNL